MVSVLLVVLALSAGCKKKHEHAVGPEATVTPSALPTVAPTVEPSPTVEPTPTAQPTPLATPTPTASPSPSDGVDWDKAIADARVGRPKDLKVLSKKMSATQVVDYMETISSDLGVQCAFCHPKADFLVEHEHRARALEMMTMQNELVKTFFSGKPEIGCITCHRGKAEPDVKFKP